jgi:hypothetical protein
MLLPLLGARYGLLFSIFTTSILSAAPAHADDVGMHAVGVSLTSGYSAVRTSQGSGGKVYAEDPYLQLGVQARANRFFSIGGLVAATTGRDSNAAFGRIAMDARLHAGLFRVLDPWISAEAGVGFSNKRLGPVLGLGIGLDVYLLPVAALGLEARALTPIFFADPNEVYAPNGVSHAALIGFTFTVRFGGAN